MPCDVGAEWDAWTGLHDGTVCVGCVRVGGMLCLFRFRSGLHDGVSDKHVFILRV